MKAQKNDHRMAMAAALLHYVDFKMKIKNPNCVNNISAEFWNITGDIS